MHVVCKVRGVGVMLFDNIHVTATLNYELKLFGQRGVGVYWYIGTSLRIPQSHIHESPKILNIVG